MADVLLGSERRVLISASALPPPETLLGRLDQLDLRMKNLKEAKCACEKEKRKAEERWKPARRRWFNVGC
ncbi:hypothetical protein OsJ_19958 [Oryza sativa Japonica Group]|uniref:Uncharacterized protein n=1 Tax=Oryza sativa subsp. japonica TaxID=39947 RepID=A3B7Y4_ORYSJ|nr:hypothetical protein OsJ_19958 [Oryza sativa Japonica Group]